MGPPLGDPVAAAMPVLALLGLGALHGINPGMGWLFAVGLGLQRRREAAVWRALPPLALGHALAIAAALVVAALIGAAVPAAILEWAVAVLLGGYGAYRLVRTRHPRYGGMLVGARELVIWSFLMASAHGAGLMVVPLVLARGGSGVSGAGPTFTAGPGAAGHAAHGAAGAELLAGAAVEPTAAILASVLHTVGYLLVAGAVAALVYRRLGLRVLRTHWVNLDLFWSVALIATGALTVLL